MPFLHPLRSTSAAGVVLHREPSLLLERKHLKYNCLSLPALTHTVRKSGWRILEDPALELSARTAGQPVHVWLSVAFVCRAYVHTPISAFLLTSAWIIPLSFDLFQSTQYYDMRWSCEHLIMVWINAFVMLTTQLLPSKYCDLLHKSAAHLGKWQKLEHGSYSNAPQHMWVGWRAKPCNTFLHAAGHVYLLCMSFLFLALNI